jgi:hypothetical protein
MAKRIASIGERELAEYAPLFRLTGFSQASVAPAVRSAASGEGGGGGCWFFSTCVVWKLAGRISA